MVGFSTEGTREKINFLNAFFLRRTIPSNQRHKSNYRVISILPSLFSQLLLPLFLEGTERNCTYTRKLDKSGKGSSMLASIMAV